MFDNFEEYKEMRTTVLEMQRSELARREAAILNVLNQKVYKNLHEEAMKALKDVQLEQAILKEQIVLLEQEEA